MAEQNQNQAADTGASAADVLTLHRAIFARWADDNSLTERAAATIGSSTSRHADWVSALGAMATMGGQFGPRAWEIASEVASTPTLLQRLSPSMRSLQLGELADLIQLALEEEQVELDLSDMQEEVAELSRTAKAGPPAKSATPRRQATGTPTPNAKSLTTQRKSAAKRPAAAQAKVRELRRLLAELRAGQAADTAAADRLGGDSVPQVAGDMGPRRPEATIGLDRAAPHAAEKSAASARIAEVGSGRTAAPRGVSRRASAMTVHTQLDPWATVAQVQADVASRSLRLAEQASDMGFLDLGAADVMPADMGQATLDGSADAAPRVARQSAATQSATTAATTAATKPATQSATQLSAAASRTAALARAAAGESQHVAVRPAPSAQARTVPSVAQLSARPVAQVARAGRGATVAEFASARQRWGAGQASTDSQVVARGPQALALAAQVSSAELAAQAPAGLLGPVAQRAAASHAPDAAGASAALARLSGLSAGRGAVEMAHRVWQRAERGAQPASAPRVAPSAAPIQHAAPVAGAAQAWMRWADLASRAYLGSSPDAQAPAAGALGTRISRVAAGAADRQQLELATDAGGFADAMGPEGADQAADRLRAPGAAPVAADATARSVRVGDRPAALPAWIAPRAAAAARQVERQQAATSLLVGAARSPLAPRPQAGAIAAAMATGAPSVPGLAGAVAAGLSARVAERAGLGLGDVGAGAEWSAPSALARYARRADNAQAPQAGSVADRQAPGEWLEVGDTPAVSDLGATSDQRAAAGGSMFARATAAGGQADVAGSGATRSAPGRAVAAMAAAQAVEQARTRILGGQRALRTAAGRMAIEAAVGADDLGLLSVRPAGKADALSPWLAKMGSVQVPGRADEGAARGGTAGELLQAGEDFDNEATSDAPVSGGTVGSRSAGTSAARREQARAAAVGQATATSAAGSGRGGSAAVRRTQRERGPTAPMAASALQNLTPKALSAILAALGENPAAAPSDVATAFAARWVGRGDLARAILGRADAAVRSQAAGQARDAAAGELVSSEADSEVAGAVPTAQRAAAAGRHSAMDAAPASPGTAGTRGLAAGRAAATGRGADNRPAVTATADGDSVVLTGLAALAALASGDLFGERATTRPMKMAETEQTLVEPGPELASSGPAEASGVSAGAETARAAERTAAKPATAAPRPTSAKLAAVRLHEFAPVALRRGRNLVGQQRRASWLHTTPMGSGRGDIQATVRSLSRMAALRKATRFGYGDSSLGGGELLGLTNVGAGDTDSFFGDVTPTPGAARGADRLSQAVMARRQGQMGRGTAPKTQQAMHLPDFDGATVLPTDFSSLDSAVSSMASAVDSAGRRGGATAAAQGTQAAAMTRVLSVTASPGGNMLPLVAPAAQAIVSAAAAKPLSESIVTSGADPSMGMPMTGVGGHKAGKNSQGGDGGQKAQDSADEHAANVQDIEALAMKIARSVMVRIKRERERRGLHV